MILKAFNSIINNYFSLINIATLSILLEWPVWIKFNISQKPSMWEYVNKYIKKVAY